MSKRKSKPGFRKVSASDRKYMPTDSDRAFVNSCTIMGAKPIRIAKMLGIGTDYLYQHYGKELEFASMRADAMVVANLFRQITKDDIRAVPGAIRWVQMRLKWGGERNGGQMGKPGIMRLQIVNDPEEDLDEFRTDDDGQTIEVSGHEATSPFVDPFEGKLKEDDDGSK